MGLSWGMRTIKKCVKIELSVPGLKPASNIYDDFVTYSGANFTLFPIYVITSPTDVTRPGACLRVVASGTGPVQI